MFQKRLVNYLSGIFLQCAATQNPVGLFKDNNFKEWKNSINLNLIAQAQIMHCIRL